MPPLTLSHPLPPPPPPRAQPGLDAHSFTLPAHLSGRRIDCPYRVFTRRYYPTLTRLYAHLGLPSEGVDTSSSFFHARVDAAGGAVVVDAPPYFGFGLLSLPAGVSVPFATSVSQAFSTTFWRYGYELVRLRWLLSAGGRGGGGVDAADDESLGDFLRRHAFSDDFVRRFLGASLTLAMTCSLDAVLAVSRVRARRRREESESLFEVSSSARTDVLDVREQPQSLDVSFHSVHCCRLQHSPRSSLTSSSRRRR